jgi:hypothetical protein
MRRRERVAMGGLSYQRAGNSVALPKDSRESSRYPGIPSEGAVTVL